MHKLDFLILISEGIFEVFIVRNTNLKLPVWLHSAAISSLVTVNVRLLESYQMQMSQSANYWDNKTRSPTATLCVSHRGALS